jgi:hypothetical protein
MSEHLPRVVIVGPIEDSKGRIATLASRLPGASTRPLSFRKRKRQPHSLSKGEPSSKPASSNALRSGRLVSAIHLPVVNNLAWEPGAVIG